MYHSSNCCVYLKSGIAVGDWTGIGCQLTSVGDEITCECDHLTNFALLVVSTCCLQLLYTMMLFYLF